MSKSRTQRIVVRRRPRKKIPVPWSEMRFADKVKEAKAAIARLEQQQEDNWRSPNRSHTVSVNTADALKRWHDTLTRLRMDPEIHKLPYEDR